MDTRRSNWTFLRYLCLGDFDPPLPKPQAQFTAMNFTLLTLCLWFLFLFRSFASFTTAPTNSDDVFFGKRVELHVHLDGAVSYQTLLDVAQLRNLSFPAPCAGVPISVSDIECIIHTAESWHRFDIVNDIIGGHEPSLTLVAERFVDFQAQSGVHYTEVRYDPVRAATSSFDPDSPISIPQEAAVRAIRAGLLRGMVRHKHTFPDNPLVVHQLLCAMRGQPAEHCMALVDLAAEMRSEAPGGVVGIDLAGDELDYPNELYADCFTYAQTKNLSITIHSGEGILPDGDPDMFQAVLKMGASRIGHGYASVYPTVDQHLVDLLTVEGVHLEACPRSADQEKVLPAVGLYRNMGLNFGLSTDDPAPYFCNMSLPQVEQNLRLQLNFTDEDIAAAYERALAARFGKIGF